MENLNKIVIILFTLTFFSCTKYNINEIEKYSGLSLKNKIAYNNRIEEWDDFQGDGCAFLVFDINKAYKEDILNEVKNKKWSGFGTDPNNPNFSSEIDISQHREEISEYLYNAKGFFLREQTEKEIRNILVDTTNSRLIYYYILF